jgi:hypothetical protein
MNTQTIELIKQYANLDYFDNKSIEEIPLWELRDIMSTNINLRVDDFENILVNNIVDSVITNKNISWNSNELTIAGEAKVQSLLRDKNYNLLCFEMNIFPNTTIGLIAKIEKYSINVIAKNKIHKLLNLTQSKFYSFRMWLPRNLYFCFSLFAILSLVYAVWADPTLLIYSAIMAWAFCNCSAMIIHEWWTHDLIIPRNRVISFVFDYLGHILFVTNRLVWRFEHRWHHVWWKTDKDIDYVFKDTPKWFYLMLSTPIAAFLGKPTPDKPEGFYEEREKCYKENVVKLTPESQFLEKHWVSISVVSHTILIILLGYVNWTYFVLVQAWLFRCYIIGFNEIVTHWPMELTREQESNTPYLFPLCCGTAYHTTHHFEPTTIVLGPGWIKYVNIQYWFIRAFFKIAPGAKLS